MANLLCGCGLLYNGDGDSPGAQTVRWGGAGPVRNLLDGQGLIGQFCFVAITGAPTTWVGVMSDFLFALLDGSICAYR